MIIYHALHTSVPYITGSKNCVCIYSLDTLDDYKQSYIVHCVKNVRNYHNLQPTKALKGQKKRPSR